MNITLPKQFNWLPQIKVVRPSRGLTYPTWGSSENYRLKMPFWGGYGSSLEGNDSFRASDQWCWAANFLSAELSIFNAVELCSQHPGQQTHRIGSLAAKKGKINLRNLTWLLEKQPFEDVSPTKNGKFFIVMLVFIAYSPKGAPVSWKDVPKEGHPRNSTHRCCPWEFFNGWLW